MSRPITNPRRDPPLGYRCTVCGHTSDDFARIIEEDNPAQNTFKGDWECGNCGNQSWRKPTKAEVAEDAAT